MVDNNFEVQVREFLAALNENNAEKAGELLSDSVVYISSNGTFRGKQEAIRYIQWLFDKLVGFKIVVVGIGILTKDNIAAVEHEVSGMVEGEHVKLASMCAYEFDGNAKIIGLRTIFDRLAIAEQSADKWISRKVVHSVVDKVQEGLD